MIPTFRLLLFLLLGALLVAGVALAPALLPLALAYIVAVGALVAVDYAVTTRPSAIEVERINDSKLSLGAEVTLAHQVALRSDRERCRSRKVSDDRVPPAVRQPGILRTISLTSLIASA